MKKNKKSLGLYIHIPFCRSKCGYCDFCSFVPTRRNVVEHYVDALILQMEDMSRAAKAYTVDTVFIGGGTPTYLEIGYMRRIIDAVYRNFKVARGAEISVESNPATAELAYYKRLRRLGVNRLSIGLQSANDTELRALGRIHSFAEFKAAFEDARRAGFENINVDLMYGIPEQTVESFTYTLASVASMAPEHISLYALKVEEGTPFGRAEKDGTLELPSEEGTVSMYEFAVGYLENKGYGRYEISNFARNGYECRHNLKYWREEEYLGIGAAAHSYFGGERYACTSVVRDYINGVEVVGSDIEIYEQRHTVTPADEETEYVMLGLRLARGIAEEEYAQRFGESFEEKYGKRLLPYVEQGLVVREDGRTYFTVPGVLVSNDILSEILDLGEK